MSLILLNLIDLSMFTCLLTPSPLLCGYLLILEKRVTMLFAHWRMAFAVLGIPYSVKTDNGPACLTEDVEVFMFMGNVA